MITIRVKNFQSISDATLVVDGFTAVTGPNNTGKSAFFRAAQGLFCNAKGHGFVREGASHCQVKVTFADGTSVTWEKGKKRNRYRINKKDWLKKVSHGVPPEVAAVLNVQAVAVGSTSLWPQIGEQLQQIFLLDRPGSVLAEAISDVERVGRLNKALKVAESDRRKARSILKVRRRDKNQVEDQLVHFQGLDLVEEQIDELVPLCQQAERTRKALLELDKWNLELKREQKTLDDLEGLSEVELPEQDELNRAKEAYRTLCQLISFRDETVTSKQAVVLLSAVVEAFESVDLGESLDELAQKTALSCEVLCLLKKELEHPLKEIDLVEKELELVTAEIEVLTGEIESILQDLESCPVCGSDIEGREVLHVH